jgi:hypothetical protein
MQPVGLLLRKVEHLRRRARRRRTRSHGLQTLELGACTKRIHLRSSVEQRREGAVSARVAARAVCGTGQGACALGPPKEVRVHWAVEYVSRTVGA